MVQQNRQTFLILLCGFSCCFYQVQSSIFVVYPFQVGNINPSKLKLSRRRLDSAHSIGRNVFNETNLHLIYPTNEELVIMTPTPIEEYDDSIRQETTDATTELPDSTTAEETTTSNTESSTDAIATDSAIPKLPKYYLLKFLRKRMFDKLPKRHVPSVRMNYNKISGTKLAVTTFVPKYRQRNQNLTTAREGTSERNIEPRRFPFKRRSFKAETIEEGGSNISKKEVELLKTDEQWNTAGNRH